MKRLVISLIAACLVLIPVSARAGTPVYAGNIQVTNGANLTFLNHASGCLIATNGIVAPLACPVGTVAFQAAAPFTVTGTGPYIIGCPTCFTTTGGTISGATTFSSAVTANSTVTATGLVTGAQFANAYNGDALYFKTTSCGTNNAIGAGTTNTVQGVAGQAYYLYCGGFRYAVDASGNAGFAGQVTAAQFNVVSKRAYKYDIHPLPFNALQVLHHTDLAAFRYRKGHGDPRLPHVGIIADDSPSVLSGEKHDHLDIEALATVDAKAALELESQVQALVSVCIALAILLTLMAVAVAYLLYEKKTS